MRCRNSTHGSLHWEGRERNQPAGNRGKRTRWERQGAGQILSWTPNIIPRQLLCFLLPLGTTPTKKIGDRLYTCLKWFFSLQKYHDLGFFVNINESKKKNMYISLTGKGRVEFSFFVVFRFVTIESAPATWRAESTAFLQWTNLDDWMTQLSGIRKLLQPSSRRGRLI